MSNEPFVIVTVTLKRIVIHASADKTLRTVMSQCEPSTSRDWQTNPDLTLMGGTSRSELELEVEFS